MARRKASKAEHVCTSKWLLQSCGRWESPVSVTRPLCAFYIRQPFVKKQKPDSRDQNSGLQNATGVL